MKIDEEKDPTSAHARFLVDLVRGVFKKHLDTHGAPEINVSLGYDDDGTPITSIEATLQVIDPASITTGDILADLEKQVAENYPGRRFLFTLSVVPRL